MKIKNIFLLAILSLTYLTMNAQKQYPIGITLVKFGGNHIYRMIIGSDSKLVNVVYDTITNSSFEKNYETRKYVISKGAQDYINEFILKRCQTFNGTIPKGDFFYAIGPYTKAKHKTCTLQDRTTAVKIFSDLKKWIEISKYRNECSRIVIDLQARFIDDHAFSLSPEQQKQIEQMDKNKK